MHNSLEQGFQTKHIPGLSVNFPAMKIHSSVVSPAMPFHPRTLYKSRNFTLKFLENSRNQSYGMSYRDWCFATMSPKEAAFADSVCTANWRVTTAPPWEELYLLLTSLRVNNCTILSCFWCQQSWIDCAVISVLWDEGTREIITTAMCSVRAEVVGITKAR